MQNYKKYQRFGIVAVFAMMIFTGSAIAGKMLPYKSNGIASLFAEPVPGEVVSGVDSGIATHLGEYQSTLDCLVLPVFDGVIFKGIRFVGPTTIYAANGDEVRSILDVELDLATNTITGTFTVVGGTGRWSEASGGGALNGAVNADGTFSYATRGTISQPKKRK